MRTISRIFLSLGAAILLLATGLGAYASHGLGPEVSAATRSAFGTAIDYQFYHGLGLVAVAILTDRSPDSRLLCAAGWLLVIGIALFCGSIYATTFGAPANLGAAAPLGGTAFMAAWLALGLGAWRAGHGGAADPLA
jgi:uncharacterized membrane protein YgdD (TMEM256/DUF423 family)